MYHQGMTDAMSQPLPEGTHLAYTIYHETSWWLDLEPRQRPNRGLRCVQVAASAQGAGGGVVWEIGVVEHILGGERALKLGMFSEAWQAMAQIPEFFAALCEQGRKMMLEDVVTLLDSLGAADETERPW